MDNLSHDNITLADTGLPGGAAVDKLASSVKNFAGTVRHKAQLKAAEKYIRNGQLDKLNGGMLDRLIEAGTPPEYYVNAPVYIKRYAEDANFRAEMAPRLVASKNQPVNATPAQENVPAAGGNPPADLKKYIPYILGAVVIGLVIYFIAKKR